MRNLKPKVGVSAAAVLALVTSACGGASGSGSQESNNTVKVALQPTATSFPVWLAQDKGYFKKNDIKAKFKYYSAGSAVSEDGAAGDWDGGNMGSPPGLTASDKWNEVIVGPNSQEAKSQIMWGRSKDFKGHKPADVLKNKQILVKKNSAQHYSMLGCLNKLGLKKSEVKTLPLEPKSIPKAFENGKGTAAMTWPPLDKDFFDNSDYTNVCDGDKAGTKIYNMLVLTPDFAKNHKEQAAAYARAAYKGNDFIRKHPNKASRKLVEFYDKNGVKSTKKAAKRELELREYPSAKQALEVSTGNLQNDLSDLSDTFVKMGAFDSKPNVSKAVKSGRDVLRKAADGNKG